MSVWCVCLFVCVCVWDGACMCVWDGACVHEVCVYCWCQVKFVYSALVGWDGNWYHIEGVCELKSRVLQFYKNIRLYRKRKNRNHHQLLVPEQWQETVNVREWAMGWISARVKSSFWLLLELAGSVSSTEMAAKLNSLTSRNSGLIYVIIISVTSLYARVGWSELK